MMNRLLILALLCFTSCYYVPDTIEPRVSLNVEKRHFETLESAFSRLNEEERAQDWGKEYVIATKFAENFDLYRAISTFKRAEVLLEDKSSERNLEISYFVTLCYYLGSKYHDAIEVFEESDLTHVDPSFPPYHDLMLVLFECYNETGNEERAERIQELLIDTYPKTYQDVKMSLALKEGDLEALHLYDNSFIEPLMEDFAKEKKSVGMAQGLNALIPGGGYLYLGQKKSAITAFLLNGLFISASYYFFQKGNIAAGIITSSFEAGWYFGGIYGAGESAKYYNERIYEKHATPLMNDRKLAPVFMLEYGF